MNYTFLVVAYVASFICSSIGSRLSSLYRIRNVTDIEPILVQSVQTLFDGNKETYTLICAIIITLSRLIISLLAVQEILRELSLRNILASSFLLIIHSIKHQHLRLLSFIFYHLTYLWVSLLELRGSL
ncbi:hypothetical protein [Bacillus carboniphilus]|uniref:hypothetical protein n=1 Tax=Bacillus carboniphilus TaxID=86663 RepID=UPI0031D7F564